MFWGSSVGVNVLPDTHQKKHKGGKEGRSSIGRTGKVGAKFGREHTDLSGYG